MRTNKSILLVAACIFIFIISSCRVSYQVRTKSDNIKPAKLYENIIENELKFDDLSLKFSADIFIDDQKENCSGTIRIKKDSIIWVSLRVFTIEGFRLCLTHDSIKLINRLENTFYMGKLDPFIKKFGLDIDYNTLQAMLTNNIFFYPCVESGNNISNFKQCDDSILHCMSSLSRRKYSRFYLEDNPPPRWERRLEKELKDTSNNTETNDFVFQIIKVEPEIYKIRNVYIKNYIQQQSLTIGYNKHTREEQQQYFPKEIKIQLLSPYVSMDMKLNVESISINPRNISFPLKITDKYKEIVLP